MKNNPFGQDKPEVRNTVAPTANDTLKAHTHADTDKTWKAAHHTLGHLRDQASPGSHQHKNDDGSLRLGEGDGYSLTGDKTNASLAEVDNTINQILLMLDNYIAFTDNRTA